MGDSARWDRCHRFIETFQERAKAVGGLDIEGLEGPYLDINEGWITVHFVWDAKSSRGSKTLYEDAPIYDSDWPAEEIIKVVSDVFSMPTAEAQQLLADKDLL